MPRLLPAVLGLLLTAAPVVAQPLVQFRVGGRADAPAVVDQATADANALAAANLKKDDPAALVAYFRSRTLTEPELARIRAVIQKMGDERFEVRRAASDEAAKFGPAGIVPLRTAAGQTDTDPEVAFRAAEALKLIETVPHAQVASAAARKLAELAPADAAAALLGFLPTADSAQVEEDIRAALATLAVRGEAVDAAVLAALTDASPVRRAAAVHAIVAAAAKTPTGPAASAKPRVKAALAAEKDADARFRMAFGLATVGRDADALPVLIDLLPELASQRGRLWTAEDVLLQAAGTNRPKTPLGPDRPALERAKEAWKAWYDAHKGPDLLKPAFQPKTAGRLFFMSMDQVQYGNGRLVRLGHDMKPDWKVSALAPADLHVTDAGRVWLMEPNRNWIREWDERGNQVQVWNPQAGQPVGFQPLPDGHTVVAYPHMVVEYDDKWKEVPGRKFTQGANDIRAVAQAPGGPVYVLTGNNQQGTLIRLDEKYVALPKPQKIGTPAMQPRLAMIDRDRVLVTEKVRVVEYDFTKAEQKPGEGAWSVAAADPLSVQRLPNGNTLIADTMSLREVTADKEVVWTYTPTDNQKITRAVRR